jgi:hypothetical protein
MRVQLEEEGSTPATLSYTHSSWPPKGRPSSLLHQWWHQAGPGQCWQCRSPLDFWCHRRLRPGHTEAQPPERFLANRVAWVDLVMPHLWDDVLSSRYGLASVAWGRGDSQLLGNLWKWVWLQEWPRNTSLLHTVTHCRSHSHSIVHTLSHLHSHSCSVTHSPPYTNSPTPSHTLS